MTYKLSLIVGAGMAIALNITSSVLAEEKKATSPSPGATASSAPTATSPTADAASSQAKKQKALPFLGIISAVDQTAKTFSIAGKERTRVFRITDRSVIKIKTTGKFHVHFGDKVGAMTDVAKGQKVTGSFLKDADGSLEVQSVLLDRLFVP